MKTDQFPQHIRPYLIPETKGHMVYRCLGCDKEWGIDQLLYTCPECGSVLLLYDRNFHWVQEQGGSLWRDLFD
jgi:threonine synthase